jgi:hypothetical protein
MRGGKTESNTQKDRNHTACEGNRNAGPYGDHQLAEDVPAEFVRTEGVPPTTSKEQWRLKSFQHCRLKCVAETDEYRSDGNRDD